MEIRLCERQDQIRKTSDFPAYLLETMALIGSLTRDPRHSDNNDEIHLLRPS